MKVIIIITYYKYRNGPGKSSLFYLTILSSILKCSSKIIKIMKNLYKKLVDTKIQCCQKNRSLIKKILESAYLEKDSIFVKNLFLNAQIDMYHKDMDEFVDNLIKAGDQFLAFYTIDKFHLSVYYISSTHVNLNLFSDLKKSDITDLKKFFNLDFKDTSKEVTNTLLDQQLKDLK